MEVFTGIELENDDRLDINYCIEVINAAAQAIDMVDGMENLSEDQAKEFYEACCDCLIEGRVGLHLLRQKFSKKYNIPYNFNSKNGKIFLEKTEEIN